MRCLPLTLAAVVLLGLASSVAQAASCNLGGMDISAIGTQTMSVLQTTAAGGQPSPYSWQINFCTLVPTPATCTPAPDTTTTYVNQLDPSSGTCYKQFNQYLNNNWAQRYGGWFNAIADSSQNMFNVTLTCDETTTLKAIGSFYAHQSGGQGPYTWDARFGTKYVCGGNGPTAPPGGDNGTTTAPTEAPGKGGEEEDKASAGAIVFVVLVFVLPVIYVVGFVLYNKFKLGKAGLDLLPHPEFWKDFPRLCLDGCKFVKNKFLQCIGKGDGTGTYGGGSEGAYSQVV